MTRDQFVKAMAVVAADAYDRAIDEQLGRIRQLVAGPPEPPRRKKRRGPGRPRMPKNWRKHKPKRRAE